MNACQFLLLEDYDVFKLKTIGEVAHFYIYYLSYDPKNEKEKTEVLKLISRDKLKHLYNILYNKEVNSSATKEDIVQYIENYFVNAQARKKQESMH